MRTNVYVDGFNLYYGALKGTVYKWIDIETLCRHLLPRPSSSAHPLLHSTRDQPPVGPAGGPATTDRPAGPCDIPCVTVYLGRFLAKQKSRPLVNGGGYVWVHDTEEKGSDVNLASHPLHDAHRGGFEQAVVISNDSDLKTPIELVMNDLRLPVGLLNPHKKQAYDLRNVSTFYKPIRAGVLSASQFPTTLTDATGTFSKPASW